MTKRLAFRLEIYQGAANQDELEIRHTFGKKMLPTGPQDGAQALGASTLMFVDRYLEDLNQKAQYLAQKSALHTNLDIAEIIDANGGQLPAGIPNLDEEWGR